MTDLAVGIRSSTSPVAVTMDNVHVHNCNTGFASNDGGTGAPEFSNARVTSSITRDINTEAAGSDLVLIDPLNEPSVIVNTNTTNDVFLKYTVNVHITDRAGANISSATVTLDTSESTDYDTEAFSVSTAADGTITEQTVTKKKWAGTAETLTDYEPWRFTIEKAGYKTLTIEEVDISAPIVYRFELQSQEQPPAPEYY